MIGLISGLAGMLGMLLLWSLAWWLWKQSSEPPPEARRRPTWPSQPIPRRMPTIPPPSWLFGTSASEPDTLDDEDHPVARAHPSSSDNTNRYARAQLERPNERTELLADEPVSTGDDTCTVGLFVGPRLSTDSDPASPI